MKFAFFLLFIGLQFNIYASDSQYIDSDQINFYENAVFNHGKFTEVEDLSLVKVERLCIGIINGLNSDEVEGLYSIEVEEVFSEKCGLLIKRGKLVKYPTGKRDWLCPKCGGLNDKVAKICDHCLWNSEKDPLWVQETN